jgi:hypothetical protein
MPARVLLLGLWTEADDQGVFEWKPITIKMRIMPVDNVDVPALLSELEKCDVVKSFQQDGKTFGAERNFCKYQRPKTPKYRAIKSADIRNYVASSYPASETDQPEPEAFPQNGEMTPQMEEEGGKREEEGENSLPSAARPSEDFEMLKRVFPVRKGDMGWKAAERKFNSLVKTGVDPKVIVARAKVLAQQLHAKIGTEYIPRPEKWLSSEDFLDMAVAAFQPSAPDKLSLDDAVRIYAKGGQWSRHAPIADISQAPADLLAKYGLSPDGRRMQ